MPTISTSTTITLPAGQKLVISGAGATATATVNPGSLAQIYDVGVGQDILGPFDRATPVRVEIRSGSVTYNTVAEGAVSVIDNVAQLTKPDGSPASGGGADRRAKYFPNMPSGEAIQAAIDAAFAAGGGADVVLDYTTYTLTQAIQLREGVRLVGSGYQVTDYANPDYVSGTRLLGNGTFNLVECRATDSGTPMTPGSGAAQNVLMVMNTGCINMVLDGGIHGLKVGGVNTVGAGFSDFYNLLVLRNSAWGALFENCARLRLNHITAYFNKHGVGYGTSSGGVWNWGNQLIEAIVGGANTGMGFRLFARDGSDMNNVMCRDIGFAGDGPSVTQIDHTVTVASGTLTVSDLSKFEPGQGILSRSASNAFFADRTYYVLTRSAATGAGTITVSLSVGGAPIVPTGSGNITFRTRGWQILECVGEGATGILTFCSLMDANDVELGGAPRVSLGGMRGCLVQLGIFGGDAPNIAMRRVDTQTTLITQQECTVDADGCWQHVGPKVVGTWNKPAGIWVTPGGKGALQLGNTFSMEVLGNAYDRAKLSRHFTGAQEITNGQTLSGSTERNLTYVTDTPGGGFTLQSSVNDTQLGFDYGIFNATANSVTMNYNATAGAQLVGKGVAPANSVTIPAWTDVQIRLVKKGSTYYWAVL